MNNKKGRYEFKYILNTHQAGLLERYLQKIGLKKDEAKGGSYTVTSLYFDTPLLADYYDKQGGLKKRKKLRARIYANDFRDGTSRIWMEVKNKDDMRTWKNRSALTDKEWDSFMRRDHFVNCRRGVAADGDLNRFLYLFSQRNYRPHVVVRYKRRAYVGKFISDFRITFDSGLEACRWTGMDYNAKMTPVNRHVIMEVKFSEMMPWWFGQMLSRFDLSRQTFSKYISSVDAINRFNPIPK